MDETFYCSFVSADYIVCDCGESVPGEQKLKEHLEKEHNIVKKESVELKKPVQVPNPSSTKKFEPVVVYARDPKKIFVSVKDLKPATSQPVFLQLASPDNVVSIKSEDVSNEEVFYEEVLLEGQEIQTDDAEVQKVKEESASMVADHDYNAAALAQTQIDDGFFCERCGKSFDTERSVKRHIKMTHDMQRRQATACDTCHKRHAPNRPCGASKAVFKKKKEREYICDICGKKYAMHIRTHTGERPHACNNCAKAFSNRAALLRHQRVHTGEKPYACPSCGKRFSQSNSMKLHVRTVHLKVPTPYKSTKRRLKAIMRNAMQWPNGRANRPKAPFEGLLPVTYKQLRDEGLQALVNNTNIISEIKMENNQVEVEYENEDNADENSDDNNYDSDNYDDDDDRSEQMVFTTG